MDGVGYRKLSYCSEAALC